MTTYTDAVKQGYADLWASATVRPERVKEVDRAADGILAAAAWAQYQAVERATGVPAHVVGIIHLREASQNFHCHLHNGDSLAGRTIHVPGGRPPAPATPPFTWEQSAEDALTMPGQHLNAWADWSASGVAYVLERYNGFGYRAHGVNSPYLWGYTTAYTAGLFVADGQWNPSAVNANPGGMAILRRMVDRGLVALPGTIMPTPVTVTIGGTGGSVGTAPFGSVESAVGGPGGRSIAVPPGVPTIISSAPTVTPPALSVAMDHLRVVMADFQALGIYDGKLDADPGPAFARACAAFHIMVS